MAADFIKKLVLLNLGATEDEWADAVAIDEEAVALDAYSKTGGVALQSFFSDETPSGSAVFFYFETHADKGKPAERKLRCHSYTIPQSGVDSRAQYFLKLGDTVPPNGSEDQLMDAMQFGTLTDSLLSNMGTLLRELYVPQGGGAEQAGDAGGSPVRAAALEAEDLEAGAAKHEFQRNVVWFESVLSHAMKQVKGDVLLSVPNIDIEDAKAASEDYDVVNQLEVAMESWSKLVATVVEAENSKRPKTKGPLAEIEFWRQRNAALSALGPPGRTKDGCGRAVFSRVTRGAPRNSNVADFILLRSTKDSPRTLQTASTRDEIRTGSDATPQRQCQHTLDDLGPMAPLGPAVLPACSGLYPQAR